MSNLLVVDFDYFFRNPLEGGITDDPTWALYDWGHNESPMFLHYIWPSRAESFVANELSLPGVDIPEGWWNRFNISPDAVCEVSDSNAYSGVVNGGEEFDHVWLYDAHHDLYCLKTLEQVQDWYEEGKVTCEDWMFAHYMRGSKLHWRWPRWHKLGKELRSSIPKFTNCDARKDDMGKLDMQFDAVSICRSGCWVPPWCDQDFEQFVLSAPVAEWVEVEDGAMEQREWREAMERGLAARREMNKRVKEKLSGRAGIIP